MSKSTISTPIKRRRKVSTEALSKALTATDGKVYLAAQRLGCDPKTVYNRIQAEPALAQLLEELRGQFLDLAETALHKAVVKCDSWAVCFTLKTLGRERGYSERHEVATPPGQPLQVETATLTDNERVQRLEALFERARRRRAGRKEQGSR